MPPKKKPTMKPGAAAAYFNTGSSAVDTTPAKARPVAEDGCREGYTRRTFIARKDHIEKLQAAAYWHTDGAESLTDALENALEAYFKANKVKPKPSK